MSNDFWQRLNEVRLKIIGKWYCKELDQYFTFGFNDELHKPCDLKIVNTQTIDTVYTISARPHFRDDKDTPQHYIEIEPSPCRRFDIMSITKDMLVLCEFVDFNDKVRFTPIIYVRQIDISKGTDILKGLG
jgi:hypothetical protein